MSRRPLAGALLGALLVVPSLACAQAPKPGPKAVAPAAAQAPTVGASHLALAREVMLSSGIGRSFDSIIPAFGDQIRQATVTRPELSKDLDAVLVGLGPEMELQKQGMIDTAARIYAARLTEAELGEIAAFFHSPAGKRYVETQPQVLDDMVQAMQTWTQTVSEYVMVRVRAEMAKRGHQLQ